MRTPPSPVRTDVELFELWSQLMGPLGFASRQLWLLRIHDGAADGQLLQIADLPPRPGAEDLGGLREVLTVLGPEVAILLARPGADPAGEDDRRWASALIAAVRAAGVRCRLLHLANDREIAPLPLDDLLPLPR